MRLGLVVLGCLLLAGCAGPHTTGALWAQQNLQAELARFRLSDAQRAAAARQFELGVADDLLAQERARLEVLQKACSAAGASGLEISPGDRVRDGIRIQAQGDAARLMRVAQLALADWWQRRAASSGQSRFCDLSRAALDGQVHARAPVSDALSNVGEATVTRDAASSVVVADQPALVALSLYALGWADGVRAPAPLPQYLAVVYGGSMQTAATLPALGDRSPEEVVDELAPVHPEWEPDALYAALRSP